MTIENPRPRRDINVDYHQPSATWGIRLYGGYPDIKQGQFVAWGATTPMDCVGLPYYSYPSDTYDD